MNCCVHVHLVSMMHLYSVFLVRALVYVCVCERPLQEQSKATLLMMKMMQLSLEGGWAHMLPV